MKRRMTAWLLLLALITGILCGCKDEKTPETTGAAEDIGLTASLTLVCPIQGAALEEIGAQLAVFKERFPNVDVNLVTDPNAEGATVALVTPAEAYGYYQEGLLADMDTWANDSGLVLDRQGNMSSTGLTDEQKADLVELFYEEGCSFEKDSIYMMPFYRESHVLYYNRTYIEERDMPNPYSWESVEQICAAIKQENPEATPLFCNDMTGLFLSLCAQHGAEYTAEGGLAGLLGSDGAYKALSMLNDWYAKGYMTTDSIQGKTGKLSMEDGVYMVIGSSADSAQQAPALENESFDFELGVTTLPHFEEMTGKVLVQGPGLVILRTDDDDQMLAAWLLVKHLTLDVAFQAKLAMAGSYIPVLTSVEVNESYSDYLDHADGGDNFKALTALTGMEQQHNYFTAPVYEGVATDMDAIGQLVNSCVTMTGDVETQIQAAIEALMK